jgi:hypothetical protein
VSVCTWHGGEPLPCSHCQRTLDEARADAKARGLVLEEDHGAVVLENAELHKEVKRLRADLLLFSAPEQRIKDFQVLLGNALDREEQMTSMLREAKLALEIALPGMVHTYSGHDYEDGKLVEFVDGCGKCRAMKVLSNLSKRSVSVPICGAPSDTGIQCTRPKGHPTDEHGNDNCAWDR